ncbi:hypothetical protein EDB92DRAFT_2020388 [Lactarius akahatsu]|uniref:Uncharacterized protein n=1 Tax=Lactarius akahatsu TaxID=416441 RepID=A0AAD4LAP2_9AGAM|nr:hypothetical protein EDB92DRAFT_2020388 [Lactarius akahatsu]
MYRGGLIPFAHRDPVLEASILGALASGYSTVLTTLRRLQLSVLFDGSPGSDTDHERCCNFWGTLYPRMVLTPMQHTLTELTLHSSAYVGALFGLSFAGLHFPHLCALSLRMVVFEPSVGALNYILRHAATLARLELLRCKLLHPDFPSPTAHAWDEESSPEPDSWEYTWNRFAADLTALVALHIDEHRRDRWGHASMESRYVQPIPEGMVYSEVYYTVTPCNAAPVVALRNFQLTVAARSEEVRGAS